LARSSLTLLRHYLVSCPLSFRPGRTLSLRLLAGRGFLSTPCPLPSLRPRVGRPRHRTGWQRCCPPFWPECTASFSKVLSSPVHWCL